MEIKFYKCDICGSVVTQLNEQDVNPSCCGDKMRLLKAGSTDAATEKHVPVPARNGSSLTVKVGEVAHPMADEHFIQFIAVEQGSKLQIAYLTPDDAPEAAFTIGDGKATVYEYCNLHGLWKQEA